MATLGRGISLGATEQITNTKLHNLVDLGTCTGIVNADIDNAASISNSKVNLASISQAVGFTGGVTVSSNPLDEAKSSDVASATTPNITASTGNFIHITGTVTITGFATGTAGIRRILVFDGILTFTHNATSLILPTGANITTAAGDTATMLSEGSGNWRCTSYQRKDGSALVPFTPSVSNALSGSVIQTVTKLITTGVSLTATPPFDDTPPLYSEGNLISSQVFTPNNGSNTLIIRAHVSGFSSSATNQVIYITDATGSDPAIAHCQFEGSGAGMGYIMFSISAVDTSARTYYLLGGVNTGTFYCGGNASGVHAFGASTYGSIEIVEIKA